jgi:hypothetical protein
LTDYTNYNELKEAYILVEQSRLKLWQALNPAIESEEFQMLQDTLIKTEEINGVRAGEHPGSNLILIVEGR